MANLESRGWMLRPTILLAIPFLTLIALVHAHPNPNPFPHLEATEESQRNESMSRLKFEGLNRLLRRDEAKPGDENRGLKNGKWDYEHFEKETPPKLFYVEIDDWNTLQASAMTYFYPREYIKNEPTKGDYVWWENENEVTNHDDAFWGIFIWCQASKVSPYYDGILVSGIAL